MVSSAVSIKMPRVTGGFGELMTGGRGVGAGLTGVRSTSAGVSAATCDGACGLAEGDGVGAGAVAASDDGEAAFVFAADGADVSGAGAALATALCEALCFGGAAAIMNLFQSASLPPAL